MSRIKLLIVALLYFAGVQQVDAQSDIEVTDSISNEWGDGSGGGFNPSIPSEPVTELTLSHTAIAIAGGESFKLKAQVNSTAVNKNIVWSIADNNVARVLNDGTVFGIKAGTTTVTASSVSNPEITASCSVTVTSDYVSSGDGKVYYLTYLLDGKVYKHVAAKCGDIITPEPEPVKEGYTFSGWEGEPLIMPAADVRVTGSFSVNYYKITYILDGEVYMTKVYAYKEEITPVEAPAKEGHTFSGWEGLPETMPTEDLTVIGHYTKNSYKLTYYVDVKRYKSLTLEYGDTITPEPEPTKEGYTFSGWKGLPKTMPARNVTVTGNFTVNTYKITYMVDGEVYATVDVKYGTTITPVEEPQKEGYTFSGWSEIPETMPAHDITVTGSFTYTNIASITTEVVFNVYSLNGTLLYKNVSDIKAIPNGLYIINRRKVLIK